MVGHIVFQGRIVEDEIARCMVRPEIHGCKDAYSQRPVAIRSLYNAPNTTKGKVE